MSEGRVSRLSISINSGMQHVFFAVPSFSLAPYCAEHHERTLLGLLHSQQLCLQQLQPQKSLRNDHTLLLPTLKGAVTPCTHPGLLLNQHLPHQHRFSCTTPSINVP